MNANINVNKDNFLREALKPGLTRTMQLAESENIHENSGFGLYILYHLAKNYGNFVISSSGRALEIAKDMPEPNEYLTKLKGTLVSIEFQKYPNDMLDMLKMISDEGELEAVEEGREVKASSRSRSVKI